MGQYGTLHDRDQLVHFTVHFSGCPGTVVDKGGVFFICASDGVLSYHVLLVPVLYAGLGEVGAEAEGERDSCGGGGGGGRERQL